MLWIVSEEVRGPPSATHFNAAQPALLANERERGREVLEIDVDHSDCGKGMSDWGQTPAQGRAITALLSRKDALCTHASPSSSVFRRLPPSLLNAILVRLDSATSTFR